MSAVSLPGACACTLVSEVRRAGYPASDDLRKIIIIKSDMKDALREETQFWLVTPKASFMYPGWTRVWSVDSVRHDAG